MTYYSVKEVAQKLSVNEETVRRWIRTNKLEAERGSGRQGSWVSAESLKVFLEKNPALAAACIVAGAAPGSTADVAQSSVGAVSGAMTSAVIGATGAVTEAAIAGAALGIGASPFFIAAGGIGRLIASVAGKKDDGNSLEDLITQKHLLECTVIQLEYDIAAKQDELTYTRKQLELINKVLNK